MKKKSVSLYESLLVLVSCVVLVAGILGSVWHDYWVTGLFTHFVPHYTILGGMLAFFLLLRGVKYLSLVMFIFAAYHAYLMEPLWKKERTEDFSVVDSMTILQYNVNRENANVKPIVKWIRDNQQQFDIVVLFEITDLWKEADIATLSVIYPYHYVEIIRGDRKLGVFSKLPVDSFEMQDFMDVEGKIAFMQVRSERFNLPIELSVIHPPPPVDSERFTRRNEILLETVSLLKRYTYKNTTDYRILLGDFNITRWSPIFTRVKELIGFKDAQEGMGHMGTWPALLGDKFGIAIDHMLISPTMVVKERKTGPDLGSDHLPVITTLHIPLSSEETQ